MNRVYKIVWSKTKNAYVVTSEVARSHTKSASGKAVKAALAAAVGMGVLMGGYVADAAPATNPSGDGPGIAIGTGSSSQKVDSTAVGKNAKTTGESALAVGYDSIADADGAMAVGNGNKAMARAANPTWESPSPIMEYRFSTRLVPKREAQRETRQPTMMARTMKG